MAKTLPELLKENECETLDAYKKKVADKEVTPSSEDVTLVLTAVGQATASMAEKDEQISNLERIKGENGSVIGDLRKTVDALTGKPNGGIEDVLTEKKGDDGTVKTEADYKAENESLEATLSEEQLGELEELWKALDADTRTLVTNSEEARATYMAEALGSSTAQTQETFRRPKPKVKLSVAEQVLQGLGQLKADTTPRRATSGLGFLDKGNQRSATPNLKQPRSRVITPNHGMFEAVKSHSET